MKKQNLFATVAVAAAIIPMFAFAQTPSSADLNAQIQSLLAQIQALQVQVAAQQPGSTGVSSGSNMWCHTFNSNLQVGSSGSEVNALQTALEQNGEAVTVTGTYDAQTKAAVIAFQQKYGSKVLNAWGLVTGTGFTGVSTRAQLNSLYGCSTTTVTTNPTNVILSVVSNPTVTGSTVSAGNIHQKIASFIVTNVSSQAVTFSPSNIQINLGANASNYANLQLFVNGVLQTSSTVVTNNGSYALPNSMSLAAGASLTVDAYADVSSAAPAASVNYSSITVTLPNAVAATTVSGQSVTIAGTASGQSLMIASITPATSTQGTFVTLQGAGFGTSNKILFGSLVAVSGVSSFNGGNTITFTVPNSLTPNCNTNEACPQYAELLGSGNYQVSVETNGLTSNSMNLYVSSTNSFSL